jgi:hypothetical protein
MCDPSTPVSIIAMGTDAALGDIAQACSIPMFRSIVGVIGGLQ